MEKKFLIILLSIICIGSFLRIYKLANQSFWIDEATAIQKSRELPSLDNLESWETHWMSPPFYNLLLHFWIILFGENEFAVRSLSVVFGILTILLVYIVGADLFNKRTAVFSSLILAISPFHIAFSQDVKMYPLLSFLGLLSVYLCYKTLFSKKRFYWLVYFFVTVLMLYTHNWAIFLLISENIFFLLVKKHTINTKKYLLSQLFIGLCYLPWLPVLFKQIINSKYYVCLPLSDIYDISALLAVYCGTIIQLGESIYDVGTFSSVIGGSLYGLLFFLGLSINEQKKIDKYYFWKSKETLLMVSCFF
ncbi:glycosyltransferase family 39 protein [bacterium]|nr:glycosyltransferase family 39 protein [bacterium]